MCARRRPWWLLILLLLAGGAVWAVRLLRDDEGWTGDEDDDDWAPRPGLFWGGSDEAATADAQDPEDQESEPEPTAPVASAAPDAAAPAPAPVPDAPAAVRADARDDLTRLEGVGPKIAAALAASGITTFAALAEASEEDLRAALKAAALRSAGSLPTWPGQARLLADGDEAGFAAFVAGLSGGRGA